MLLLLITFIILMILIIVLEIRVLILDYEDEEYIRLLERDNQRLIKENRHLIA